jgi:hypothetical protein
MEIVANDRRSGLFFRSTNDKEENFTTLIAGEDRKQ